MIIPGCYSRVSWVLSSELWQLSAPGEDLYRRKLPAGRYDSSVTTVNRVTPCSAATLEMAWREEWDIAAGWHRPSFMAHQTNGNEGYLSAENAAISAVKQFRGWA